MTAENSTTSQVTRDAHVFGRQQLLHTIPRNQEDERRALTFLNKNAPDLVGMVMGHLL